MLKYPPPFLKRMWGQHPKTGKPIRILQTETSIWRDAKTLVFPRATGVSNLWSRYDVGTVGAATLTPYTDILILCEAAQQESDVAWLKTAQWQTVRMIMASKAVLDTIGEAALKEMAIGNLVCLEEIGSLFPFVKGEWEGTTNDACLLAGLLLRMSHVLGVEPSPTRAIRASAELTPPRQLWFITQYYKPEKARRAREISACLAKNLDCAYIDRVVLLNETDMIDHYPKSANLSKIKQEVIGSRLTYGEVLRWIKDIAPPNTICVFANSDIYLDSSWKSLWTTSLENRFLSLLRYEADDSLPDDQHTLFGPRADSQDTWVVLSDSVKSRTWDWKALDFSFGKAGCDNAINVEMLKAKFLVTNPALTLRTHHLHTSQIRTYDPQDIVDKPMYFYIQPTGLHDMQPIFSIPAPVKEPCASFSRQVKGTGSENQVKTFCTMLTRGEKYELSHNSPNTCVPEPFVYHEVSEVFQTIQGLAYTYNSLLVGKSKKGSEFWNKSHISGLSPSIGIEVGLIAPFPDEYAENSAAYVLYYLSTILQLREKAGGVGDFWSPRQKNFLDALQLFNWKKREVPVLPRDETMQVWCKKAYLTLPTDKDVITKEQIAALRRNFAIREERSMWGWPESPDERKRAVVLFDDTYCNRDFVKELEASIGEENVVVVWPGNTSTEVVARKLAGASHVFVGSGPGAIQRWGWLWIAPLGAKVVEVQNEMAPDGDCLHLCAAAGLNHTLHITPKGSISATVRKNMVDACVRLFSEQTAVASTQVLSTKPILVIPKQPADTFFSHAGDSFREMARMWAERGYATIEEDPSAHNVWLGAKGNVLLYDRPTYEWLDAAPANEQVWRKALFGNPAPRGSDSVSWSFWPRRPALVEAIAETSAPARSYGDRTQSLVLYGKIENAVQKKRRSGLNWASACSEFVMPVGGEKAYPFSQEEYLQKLTHARFGLCLPGYGWKCHREVECMAMGCVPIVTPEVDMGNYAEPPVEGTHYLVAETPEEARRLSLETTAEKWQTMSSACVAWWKRNASCEGMWSLTKNLADI
jgi:hypothetical protein